MSNEMTDEEVKFTEQKEMYTKLIAEKVQSALKDDVEKTKKDIVKDSLLIQHLYYCKFTHGFHHKIMNKWKEHGIPETSHEASLDFREVKKEIEKEIDQIVDKTLEEDKDEG